MVGAMIIDPALCVVVVVVSTALLLGPFHEIRGGDFGPCSSCHNDKPHRHRAPRLVVGWTTRPREKLTLSDWLPNGGFLFYPNFSCFLLFISGLNSAAHGELILCALAIAGCTFEVLLVVLYLRRPVQNLLGPRG
jgi:hypothetical protein